MRDRLATWSERVCTQCHTVALLTTHNWCERCLEQIEELDMSNANPATCVAAALGRRTEDTDQDAERVRELQARREADSRNPERSRRTTLEASVDSYFERHGPPGLCWFCHRGQGDRESGLCGNCHKGAKQMDATTVTTTADDGGRLEAIKAAAERAKQNDKPPSERYARVRTVFLQCGPDASDAVIREALFAAGLGRIGGSTTHSLRSELWPGYRRAKSPVKNQTGPVATGREEFPVPYIPPSLAPEPGEIVPLKPSPAAPPAAGLDEVVDLVRALKDCKRQIQARGGAMKFSLTFSDDTGTLSCEG